MGFHHACDHLNCAVCVSRIIWVTNCSIENVLHGLEVRDYCTGEREREMIYMLLLDNKSDHDHMQRGPREREAFYILCPASSLMDVPGYVNPDKLMNVPIGFVCR